MQPTTAGPSRTATSPPGIGDAQARDAAESAAQRAGVKVRELRQLGEVRDAAELLSLIWDTTHEEPPVPGDVLRALAHAGNYVAGAFVGPTLAGVSMGFFSDGVHRGLHSHVAGVRPDWQGRKVGFALKQHQRAWALAHSATVITWTYDPLVRRNAFFNLVKLGASAVSYLPNFYGPMKDGINAGDDSDRLLVRWDLTSQRATRASLGHRVEVARGDGFDDPQKWLLFEDRDGSPVSRAATGDPVVCQVPEDIARTRKAMPALGAAWRKSLRESMQQALERGYRIDGMTRDGWYILRKAAAS